MYVLVNELPQSIQRALRSVNYNRKDIEVEVGETFSAPGAFGSGHRARVMVVNIATGAAQYEEGSWGGGNPFEHRPVDQPSGSSKLPAGFVALTSSHSKFWTLHVNPANAAKLLPEAKSTDLTIREMWILHAHKGLTSAGRKDEFRRGAREMGGPPKPEEIQSLAQKGLIKVNAAGSSQITTEGRNVVEEFRKKHEFGIGISTYQFAALLNKKSDTVTADDIMRGAGLK